MGENGKEGGLLVTHLLPPSSWQTQGFMAAVSVSACVAAKVYSHLHKLVVEALSATVAGYRYQQVQLQYIEPAAFRKLMLMLCCLGEPHVAALESSPLPLRARAVPSEQAKNAGAGDGEEQPHGTKDTPLPATHNNPTSQRIRRIVECFMLAEAESYYSSKSREWLVEDFVAASEAAHQQLLQVLCAADRQQQQQEHRIDFNAAAECAAAAAAPRVEQQGVSHMLCRCWLRACCSSFGVTAAAEAAEDEEFETVVVVCSCGSGSCCQGPPNPQLFQGAQLPPPPQPRMLRLRASAAKLLQDLQKQTREEESLSNSSYTERVHSLLMREQQVFKLAALWPRLQQNLLQRASKIAIMDCLHVILCGPGGLADLLQQHAFLCDLHAAPFEHPTRQQQQQRLALQLRGQPRRQETAEETGCVSRSCNSLATGKDLIGEVDLCALLKQRGLLLQSVWRLLRLYKPTQQRQQKPRDLVTAIVKEAVTARVGKKQPRSASSSGKSRKQQQLRANQEEEDEHQGNAWLGSAQGVACRRLLEFQGEVKRLTDFVFKGDVRMAQAICAAIRNALVGVRSLATSLCCFWDHLIPDLQSYSQTRKVAMHLVALLQNMPDKATFLEIYRRHLGNRLLQRGCRGVEQEKMIAELLERHAGVELQATVRIAAMPKDIEAKQENALEELTEAVRAKLIAGWRLRLNETFCYSGSKGNSRRTTVIRCAPPLSLSAIYTDGKHARREQKKREEATEAAELSAADRKTLLEASIAEEGVHDNLFRRTRVVMLFRLAVTVRSIFRGLIVICAVLVDLVCNAAASVKGGRFAVDMFAEISGCCWCCLLLQQAHKMEEAALAAEVQGPERSAAAEQLLQQALASLIEREFLRRDEENPEVLHFVP
ncbi:hypothetical protein cyc_07917 [Cyclospora cayetanensis]|uniref:Cullin family profile domain-containing protein n=1 Tax=Cyclospora cayetanensis TaxID=88456 RepID=A0A1D3CV61_9EIME|nr:hypothetical protein cyc_07917 [Cyclospora cayetanensis]